MSLEGVLNECLASISIHNDEALPLLVDQGFLRSFGCGQIDLARFVRLDSVWHLEVFEVKSSRRVGFSQRRRLERSCELLSTLFSCSSKLNFIFASNCQRV